MYDTVPTVLPGSVSKASAARVALVGGVDPRRSGRRLREPEVEDLRSVRSQEQIRRFDVAMHDALAVRGVQRIGHRECDVDEDRNLHLTARESLLECLAFEQLHGDERRDSAPGPTS